MNEIVAHLEKTHACRHHEQSTQTPPCTPPPHTCNLHVHAHACLSITQTGGRFECGVHAVGTAAGGSIHKIPRASHATTCVSGTPNPSDSGIPSHIFHAPEDSFPLPPTVFHTHRRESSFFLIHTHTHIFIPILYLLLLCFGCAREVAFYLSQCVCVCVCWCWCACVCVGMGCGTSYQAPNARTMRPRGDARTDVDLEERRRRVEEMRQRAEGPSLFVVCVVLNDDVQECFFLCACGMCLCVRFSLCLLMHMHVCRVRCCCAPRCGESSVCECILGILCTSLSPSV